MNRRTNLQETTALLLTKMEVKEELQMNRGAADDLDIQAYACVQNISYHISKTMESM